MKTIGFCLLLSLIVCKNAASQNLVPNPSFEDTVSCPISANQVDRCLSWYPSRESPDYYNECNVFGNASVPNNYQGYQLAKSGSAYCGFVGYYLPAPNQREYMTCELISPLTIGKHYLVSFYVNLANNSYRLISNNIGLLFSTANFSLSTPAPIGNYAQFYSDSLVSDTLNWIYVEGSFIADSNYSYMSVGNFFDDINTDTIYTPPASYSYYYIDDISVIEDSVNSVRPEEVFSDVLLFPNPFTAITYVHSKKKLITNIEVINVNGLCLQKIKNTTEEYSVKVDLKNYNSGIYVLKIYFNDTVKFYKILKM